MAKLLLFYGLLIGYLLTDVLFLTQMEIPFYNEIVNPAIWVVMCGIAFWLGKNDSQRITEKNDKFQSLLIVLIIYIICYFALGLVFGFQKTPYSKDLLSILSNLWIFGGIIVFQEFMRNAMIRADKKSFLNFSLITVIFILLNINFNSFLDSFDTFKDGFIYISSIIIPLVVTQAILTYLSYIGGMKFPIVYRLVLIIPELLIPIIPDLDWFATAIIGVILPVATFVYLNYVHIRKTERLSKRASKKFSPVIYIPVFAFIVLAAGFVMGLFKYQPIAVLSGSMSPTFNRGDAVVVRKLDAGEKKRLERGDIIQFQSGARYVIHRIEEVSNDEYGNIEYITKGDHNNTTDSKPVSADEVIGKASFVIPFIGYPSVWLSGAI